MGAFDVVDLRERFVALTRRAAGNPLAGLPSSKTLLDGGMLRRPVVCTGSSNPLAEAVRGWVRASGNLLGIVDDRFAGTERDGVPVVGSGDLAALRRNHPELLLVNASMLEGGFAHFGRLALRLGIDCVNTLEFRRLVRAVDGALPPTAGVGSPLLLLHDPLAYYDATVDHAAAFIELERLWADPLSAATMYHVLMFRLTFDPSHLSRASVGGLDAPPGPGAYLFDTDLFSFDGPQRLVDGGAYRGESFSAFHAALGDACEFVHAFEPDGENLAHCRARATELFGAGAAERGRVDPRGLWHSTGRLAFASTGYQERSGAASHLVMTDDPGALGVDVVALDEALDRPPTFIKLEVEGAERAALKGARRTIERHRPGLSLGAYHRPLDLIDLAHDVAALDLGYRLHLRHHTPTDWVATVCYGVP